MTDSATFFQTHLSARPVMVILRGFTAGRTVELCQVAAEAGVGLIEVPVQSPDALPALDSAVAWGREAGVPVGAGTVTTPELVSAVAARGAAFTVAPGFALDVLAASERAALPHLPGVGTGSEVQAATRAGLVWLKAFPAAQLSAGWIAAMAGPFPQACFVATGGVDVANAPDFLGAGAKAVSLGSSFADADPAALRSLLTGSR